MWLHAGGSVGTGSPQAASLPSPWLLALGARSALPAGSVGDPNLLPRNCWLLLITAAPSMSLSPAQGVPRAWFADRKLRAGITAGVHSCPSPASAAAAPCTSPLRASAGAGERAVEQPWSSLKQNQHAVFCDGFFQPDQRPNTLPQNSPAYAGTKG